MTTPQYFVTRFYTSIGGGVGKYEQSLYAKLCQFSNVQLTEIVPFQCNSRVRQISKILGIDIQAILDNHPYQIPVHQESLIHLSNELLSPALLFHHGPSVTTVHHLPPIFSKEFQKEAGIEWFVYLLCILSLKKSDRIVVDSTWTAHQIQRRLRIPTSKIKVIPLAVDHSVFMPLKTDSGLIEKYNLGNGPYILYVGGFEVRKNLPILAQAIKNVASSFPNLSLLLVGPKQRRGLNLETIFRDVSNYKILGFVPLEDLVGLYNLADVFVMPSKLEGFCLPVLEAMACGCPVVASSATAIPELIGPAGILFDPDDSDQLSNSLKRILSDPNARYQYKLSGIERASKYTWENTAKLTASVYSDLV